MKTTILTTALACLSLSLFAQDLPGFKTSNYNGVIGVYSNPANVAQNNYRWDVNLFSFGVGVGNNNASWRALKLGPLFIGSGSIITAALSESKQADFFFGIRFGGLAK